MTSVVEAACWIQVTSSPFVIRLAEFDADAEGARGFAYFLFDIPESELAVDAGFACTQQIEIRTVEIQDTHGGRLSGSRPVLSTKRDSRRVRSGSGASQGPSEQGEGAPGGGGNVEAELDQTVGEPGGRLTGGR